MRKKIAITAFAALLTPIAASALEVGVQGIYWMPKFSADLEIDGGTKFSATDDFGVDDDQGIPGVRAFFGIGDHHISVSGQAATYDGTKTISEDISWGDTVIVSAGQKGSFTYDYTMIDATYQYDLIDLENVAAGFSLGPVFNLKYLDGTVEIENETVAAKETQDFTAPIPMVGLGLHVGILLDLLEARAQVAGIGYGGNRVLDGLAEISFTPFPFLDISAGYRMMSVNIDYSDVKLELSQRGPYAGVTLSF
ncbi:hypothetical protein EPN96_05800 [bacterium]|nr:MAG: hypothetical protein EPN96_05800 [bacterium]